MHCENILVPRFGILYAYKIIGYLFCYILGIYDYFDVMVHVILFSYSGGIKFADLTPEEGMCLFHKLF